VTDAPIIETGYQNLNPVEEAISQRRSVRAFLPDPVSEETIARILYLAGRAPSGTNMQPWKVEVVTGGARDALCADLVEAHHEGGYSGEYQYYPKEFFEPFKGRRRTVGWALYGLLDIKKGDFEKTQAQHARNFTFFDAPVGLIFTINRGLEIGSWLDFGMFMQNVMILARSHGLETCPQAAFATFHKVIRQHIELGEEDVVVAGMALGKADWSQPENTLITERVPLEDYVRFHRG
jgi:nitroreductase